MSGDKPPVIDLDKIRGEMKKPAETALADLKTLLQEPVEIAIGEKVYMLHPPTTGKVRLVTKMVIEIFAATDSVKRGAFAGATDEAEEKIKAAVNKLVEVAFDRLIDVVRVLLEPNGKVIVVESLSVSREELEFSLTSGHIQFILAEVIRMVDLSGLKKTLAAVGKL